MKFIIGKKLHMTRKFNEEGQAVPVTAVQAGPCVVTQVKTTERDGYSAVQIGFGKAKKATKSVAGHDKQYGPFRYHREFRVESVDDGVAGKEITVGTFAAGDKVKIVALSKGKGFQGVVKRWGFSGSPASHGHKDQLRMPGSIGATDAARVFKGKRMGGRMGGKQVTVVNLEVVDIDEAANVVFVKGAVPGARGTVVTLYGPGELVFVEEQPAKSEPQNSDKEQTPEAKTEQPAEQEDKAIDQEEKPAEQKTEQPADKQTADEQKEPKEQS